MRRLSDRILANGRDRVADIGPHVFAKGRCASQSKRINGTKLELARLLPTIHLTAEESTLRQFLLNKKLFFACGWTDERSDGRTHGRTDGRKGGRSDGRTVGRTDGWSNGRLDGRTDGRTVRRTDGRSDARTDGRTVGRRDNGRSDGRLDIEDCWAL